MRGASPGPLFCPIDRTGNLHLGHTLTGEAIRQILSRRALAAGLAAGLAAIPPTTYAGPAAAISSTPAPICLRCSSSWAAPPRR